MIPHVFQSFAQGAGVTLHVDVLRGENDHHKLVESFLWDFTLSGCVGGVVVWMIGRGRRCVT